LIDRQLNNVLGRDGRLAGPSCASFADARFVSPVCTSGSAHGSPAATGQNQGAASGAGTRPRAGDRDGVKCLGGGDARSADYEAFSPMFVGRPGARS
jgi:hypothetical protein